MDTLIASLPQKQISEVTIYDNSEGNEGNICTKKQVKAAIEKGWKPKYKCYSQYYSQWVWDYYEGSDDVETGITLPATETVEANTPVYTLSGQKMTGSMKGKKGVYIVGGKKMVIK